MSLNREKVAILFLPKYSRYRGYRLLLYILRHCPNSPFANLPPKDKQLYCKNVSASIANSTWSTYKTALKHYRTIQSQLWPFSPQLQIRFLNMLQNKLTTSALTIKSYFSAISFFNNFLGFDSIPKSRAISLSLRGFANTKLLRKKKEVSPISFRILKTLRKKLKKSVSSKLKFHTYWAACSLAFFGSLRLSEILTTSENKYDITSDLCWSDILTGHHKSIQLRIKHPKISPANPIYIPIFAFPKKNICPIEALQKLKKIQKHLGIWEQDAPVFKFKNSKLLNIRKFTKNIKLVLSTSKFNKLSFSARSFRAGIPSEMQKFPHLFNDLHTKNWGRWKSKSYQRYMKKDFVQKEWIFKQIISILK